MKTQLLLGDCLDKLTELEDNSIDSIVTDPPYGLSFMGKKWDYDVPSQAIWEECMRVLKPGGYLLSFGGSRTYHRMAVRIEDAGFEIRDQIMWIYGSGFPKSHNIGKAVDKIQGNEREVVGGRKVLDMTGGNYKNTFDKTDKEFDITKGQSPYEGWGTALKPAHEPIVMARKPFGGTVANNVLEWGTGGINIDGCRVGFKSDEDKKEATEKNQHKKFDSKMGTNEVYGDYSMLEPQNYDAVGRFPANIIFECTCENPKVVADTFVKNVDFTNDKQSNMGWGTNKAITEPVETTKIIHTDPSCPCYILDEQSGKLNKQAKCKTDNKSGWQNEYVGGTDVNPVERKLYLDEGGASRFFYCPKANKSDRDAGLEVQAKSIKGRDEGQDKTAIAYKARPTERQNIHPTVKPTTLMQYLIRLVTPKGGTVLDPFMGSGSTGKAAVLEGMNFVGIEREEEYYTIAEQRIGYVNQPSKHEEFFE